MDLGKKIGNLVLEGGGLFWNFGFGLRGKSWEFGFVGWVGYSGTLDLDLWEKVGNLDLGGYSGTSDLDLGKKVGNFDWGGYSGTSDLDLGKKVGNLDGGYSGTSDLDLWEKVGNLDWGGILELRIWT